jgi:hypothetical protein
MNVRRVLRLPYFVRFIGTCGRCMHQSFLAACLSVVVLGGALIPRPILFPSIEHCRGYRSPERLAVAYSCDLLHNAHPQGSGCRWGRAVSTKGDGPVSFHGWGGGSRNGNAVRFVRMERMPRPAQLWPVVVHEQRGLLLPEGIPHPESLQLPLLLEHSRRHERRMQ